MLSDRAKNWLACPKALVALTTIVGAFAWGLPGVLAGFLGGLALSLLIGVAINAWQGGGVPRKVKRDLVANFISRNLEAVRAAYPDMEGSDQFGAIEKDVEAVVRRAIQDSVAAGLSHEQLWTPQSILGAASNLAAEAGTPEKRELMRLLRQQIMRDWYGR